MIYLTILILILTAVIISVKYARLYKQMKSDFVVITRQYSEIHTKLDDLERRCGR
jgi:hypothetical protein